MTPYEQAIAKLNQQYANTKTNSAPAKPTTLQKVGGFAANVGKAIASPFARLGVEAYNVTSGTMKALSGDVAGGSAELDKPRNLPLLGQTKPTLTNSSKPGVNELADVAGQGVQLGTNAVGLEGGTIGSGFTGALKTGGAYGATQGFGNALTETQGKSFEQNIGNIATQTAVGGATGAAVGGATHGIHQIFSRPTPIMNPADVGLTNTESGVKTALQNREQAGANAVANQTQMNQQVGEFKTGLGTNFQQGAQQIEVGSPELKLNLTNKQLETLNNLKESKLFSLPETVDAETNPLMGTNMSPATLARNAGKLNELQNATKASLSPTEAQDLIKRLNKLTFAAKASGDLSVNQQTIGLTNELKDAAKQAFKGTEWENVYSDYSKGMNAVEKLDGIVNLEKNATPADLNKSLNSILKLGETPEGKTILKNAVAEYKDVSGIDLTDPIKAMHQILDKQLALEEAQSASKTAQAEAHAIAKKGTGWDQFKRGAGNKEYLGKRLIEGVAIGAGSSILIYPALKKLAKMLTGQP